MASNKTRPTRKSVEKFLNAVEDERKRQDCRSLADLMEDIIRDSVAYMREKYDCQ